MEFSSFVQVIGLSLWHAYLKQHYGRMANLLQKMNEEKNQKEIMEEMKLVVRAADWSHIEEVVQKICTSYPSSYRLF